MTRVLKLQCDSGISGDMVVGALLDLGADQQGLQDALQSLGLEGYSIKISRKLAGSLDACDFDVVMEEGFHNHDHDMEWLYGNLDAQHEHDHDHGHHDHHHHHHHHHHHEHRNLANIQAIIEQSGLSAAVQQTALRIFTIIAEAEAKAHGQTVETVHFHEVGAVDSIVDVVASAWCLDNLGVDDVVVSPLAEGEGSVRSAHGILSIPVPAVANIVESHGLVLKSARRTGELVTPTGAAIAAAIGNRSSLPALYRLVGTGIGTGKRAYDPPSTLRAFLVDEVAENTDNASDASCLWKLETEVDDCTGEALGFVLNRLYAAGAKEAHFIPVFMKKGRPGYQIEVLCEEQLISALEDILFMDTTTIGVRRHLLQRTALLREQEEVQTPYGVAQVKCVVLPNGTRRRYPEHDSVAQVATNLHVSYQDALRLIQQYL